MTIHYHGTPITPRSVLYELAGRSFCVRYGEHRDAEVCHQIGQSVVIDNGAFQRKEVDWEAFYRWVEPWLDFHTTWAIVPDVIGGGEIENNELIDRWPHGFKRAAPVWHLHESFDRLEWLVSAFDRVCFGSSEEFWQIGTQRWNNRVNEAFNRICKGSGRPPAWIHMLRGMSLSGSDYPFSSVDSTDIARNHEQVPGKAKEMARRWDALQCPARWKEKPVQETLELLKVEDSV